MPSTLYRPHRHQQVAAVVDFDAARSRLKGIPPATRPNHRTLLVRCGAMVADEEVLRHIGINGESTLDEVQRVLQTAFAVPDDQPSPTRFTEEEDDAGRLDACTELGCYLRDVGDTLYFHWGLWRFTLSLADAYPRDAATPAALCVAGTGDFGDRPFDISAINAQLIGPSAIETVLAGACEEVRDVVTRSRTMDFLPLLQALDLARAAELDREAARTIEALPRERTPRARDAFWCTVLALSCLADDATTDDILEATMAALDWAGDDGEPLSAQDVRTLCAGSLVRLARIGGYGPGQASPVDRLDIFRAILRA